MNAHGILNSAAAAINERASERDLEQERSMARTVQAFNALTGHDLSETEGWLFMVILKAARATVGAFQSDDWIDMAGYAGLAGESAEKEQQRLNMEGVVASADSMDPLSKVAGIQAFIQSRRSSKQEPSEQIIRHENYGGTSDD